MFASEPDQSKEAKIPPRTPKSNSVVGAGHQHSTPRHDHSGNSSNTSTREVRNVLSSELSGKVFEGVPINNFRKIFLNCSENTLLSHEELKRYAGVLTTSGTYCNPFPTKLREQVLLPWVTSTFNAIFKASKEIEADNVARSLAL